MVDNRLNSVKEYIILFISCLIFVTIIIFSVKSCKSNIKTLNDIKTPKFKVNDCIKDTTRESWERVNILKINKVGNTNYHVAVFLETKGFKYWFIEDSSLYSRSFYSVKDWTKIDCPKAMLFDPGTL